MRSAIMCMQVAAAIALDALGGAGVRQVVR
jgi:hypothetical protein